MPGLASAVLVALLLVPTVGLATPPAAKEPWRLARHLPQWLSVELKHRTRFEYLFDDFRAVRTGNAHAVVFRTLLHGKLEPAEWITVGAEMIDSRATAFDDSAGINTGVVDTTDLLQAYVDLHGSWPTGMATRLRAGRLTLDLGDRRLVARNRFRNTINGFTGIDLRTAWGDGNELRAFWVLPVQRLPFDPERVRDNETAFDEESFRVQFAGLFAQTRLGWGDALEGFAYGLHERDSASRPTRNRKLVTPGFRLVRASARGRFDYQLESMLQFGRSRATPLPSDTRDLDHFAHFHHVEVGYTFDLPVVLRAALQFDYASGDRDPGDGSHQRFDTLFGARRFDFGPTGLYGPFVRANLITPGLRAQLRTGERFSTFLAFRSFWLASRKDGVTAMLLRDPTGRSGRHVASQLELRMRYALLPGNVGLEVGYAHLFAGEFMRDAPNSNGQGDSDYLYVQVSFDF